MIYACGVAEYPPHLHIQSPGATQEYDPRAREQRFRMVRSLMPTFPVQLPECLQRQRDDPSCQAPPTQAQPELWPSGGGRCGFL
eukprot:1347821-Amphidinium_carterae.1